MSESADTSGASLVASGGRVRWPNLFIVGAPKSGTTSLYEYLAPHPEIFLSPVKEPSYFAADVGTRRNRFAYGTNESRYVKLFEGAGTAKRVGEASTNYLFSRRAPELIRAVEPRPWIIAMLRDPVDFMYSWHGHRVAGNTDEIEEFDAALEADLQPGYGGPLRAKWHERLGTYRERARFGEQLPRWIEAFGRDRVLVIIFDDFVADTAGQYRRVLEFLEVDPDFQPPSFAVHNPRHGRPTLAARLLFRNRASGWVLKSVLPNVIGVERAAELSDRVKHSGVNRPAVAARRPVPDDLRRRLQSEFVDDVSRVGELVGRDLVSLWFKPTT